MTSVGVAIAVITMLDDVIKQVIRRNGLQCDAAHSWAWLRDRNRLVHNIKNIDVHASSLSAEIKSIYDDHQVVRYQTFY